MGTFETILWGIASSITASIILVVVSQLWSWNAKSNIKNCVKKSKELFYTVELRLDYVDDYNEIMQILRNAQEYLVLAFEHFRFFTYISSRSQRRVMFTLIYDLLRVCERSGNITVGYSDSVETTARLKKIAKMFNAPELQKWRQSLVMVKCDLLIALLNNPNWKSLWTVLNDNIDDFSGENIDFVLSFIDANSYKTDDKEPIKSKGISREEFISILRQYKN